MKSFIMIVFTLLSFLVVSCVTGSLKREEIDPWLKTISGEIPHEMDLTGKWKDAGGNNNMLGWGQGHLQQDESNLSGAIGQYNVKGIVSGKKVYLVFLNGGSVYYTARLEMLEKDVLTGNYFEADDKKQEYGYPMSIGRMKTE